MFSANPPNPFHATHVEWDALPAPARLRVLHDDSRSVVRKVDSPDLPFAWSANPYRGCTHACAYCYARRTHEYLDLGAGQDFERVVLVKVRAPELLREALTRPSWRGEPISMSGVTDCYQPLERTWRLTRGMLEVLLEFQNPVSVITRSPGVARDIDVLAALAALGAARVTISVPLLDPVVCRALEPGAAPPAARFRAMRALSDAGVPVGVSMAPMIPGLSDRTVPQTLQHARDAGARWAFMGALRLPGSVAQVFEERVRERLPDQAGRVLAAVARRRLNPSNRMQGDGPTWDATQRLFQVWHAKLGFESPEWFPGPTPYRRPGQQLTLFQESS
jgi:DNA repair photolyase